MLDNKPEYSTIKNLFSDFDYVIPIYQRAYAWKNNQIEQLIQDIADSVKKANSIQQHNLGSSIKNYYIGTLITYKQKKGDTFEYQVIDGQQRLTTLTLLLDYLKNNRKDEDEIDMEWYSSQKLHFDCRQKSTQTLDYLFNSNESDSISFDYSVTIKDGYDDICKCFNRICKETGVTEEDFCKYLFDHVLILRVVVPFDTDLNHYFEIMNSRGEQLEKSEILKAKCLEKLHSDNDRYTFALIWDACSNMERYVQYGFSTKQRDILFGTDTSDDYKNYWNRIPKCPEEIFGQLISNDELKESSNDAFNTIEQIIDNPSNSIKPGTESNESKESERFNSIINFSNFLLHILKILTQTDIPLDDKRLLDTFDDFFKGKTPEENEAFVKQFGYCLLKGKMLYDRYIIKREYISGIDKWSLKTLTIKIDSNRNKKLYSYRLSFDAEKDNQEIIMLLSMFHVSTPTLVYKHWLNAALNFLFINNTETFSSSDYITYLQNIAKSFFFDRYVAINPLNYYDIIYINKGVCQNKSLDTVDKTKLNTGVEVENFIFNYLDYLLWKDYVSGTRNYISFEDSRISNFEYTFRSSVEHYYPQTPIEDGAELSRRVLDNFGNLCLISSRKNSRLNNFMPAAKKDYYSKSSTIDSIKQRVMMEYSEWDVEQIQKHGELMTECLFSELDNNNSEKE